MFQRTAITKTRLTVIQPPACTKIENGAATVCCPVRRRPAGKIPGGAEDMIIQVVNARENPCPRCSGSLSINTDQFGDHFTRLMYGQGAEVRPAQGMYESQHNLILDTPGPMGV